MSFINDVFDPGGLTGGGDPDKDPLGIGARGRQPGGKKGTPTNESAEALAEISKQMFQQTAGVRGGLIDRSQSFLDGNLDVTASPQFMGIKNAADVAFQRARDNTIARTAPGGGLIDALAGVEGERANTLVQGAGAIAGDEMNRAFGLGTGLLPTTTAGLGQAANVQAQQIASQQAQQAAGKQAAGTGAGILMATLLS